MASASGSTRDLNDGRTEALHALLHSLSSGSAASQTNDAKFSDEQVRKLSTKLEEILGPISEGGDGPTRNEKGELVNEEGLPIIDINEPISISDTAPADVDELNNFDDPGLLPLWTLSPVEKARRKAERDRILDTLEEEERLEQTREAEASRAQWYQEMEKRKEAAKTEMENLKRARELQKKMGRALLRSVVEGKEREKAELEEADREAAAKKALKPKKSVSFVDELPEDKDPISSKGKEVDWGDVAPGRLRAQGQSSLLTRDHMDKLPMKMHVVERHPRAMQSQEPPTQEADSDDESAAGSLVAADSEDGEIIRTESEDEGEAHHGRLAWESDDGLQDEDEHGEDKLDDWGGDDLDYARHQREIALEYYEKRKAIGTEAAGAMRAHTHDEDEWDQPEVPLEATLSAPGPKPSMSRFKAEHMSHPNGSGLASHSLGGSVLPSSHSASLKHAVRLGKLASGKLVGGEEGESDGELDAADENVKAMLEMLKNGEVTNIGPAPVAVEHSEQNVHLAVPTPSIEPETETMMAQPKPSKVSKFKMSLGQLSSSHSPLETGGGSTSVTPIDQANRSSPKTSSPSSRHNTPPRPPTLGSKVVERQMPGMIVDSPSFFPPATVRQQGRPAPPLGGSLSPAFHSVILESPSFQPPNPTAHSSTFQSVILESPSFQSPAVDSLAINISPSAVSSASVPPVPPSSTPLRSTVVERHPPAVVSARESQVPAGDASRKQKVSRFKREKMQ